MFSEEKHFNIINGEVTDPGDIYFAYYVNNTITREFPRQDSGYTLDTEKSNCTNGVIPSWDDTNWSVNLNYKNYNASEYTRTKCNLYFKKKPASLAAALANSNLYFFKNVVSGANPNNYIYFNCTDYDNQSDSTCEKWRILSLEYDSTNPSNAKIKIRRAEAIDKMPWDSSYECYAYGEGFSDSTIFAYLNNEYYANLKNDTTRNMIAIDADRWYNGSIPMDKIDNIIMNDVYSYVTNSYVSSSVKIGLINASEYVYSAGEGSTDHYWCLNIERTKYRWNEWPVKQNCPEKSWIYDSAWPQWTITESDEPTAVIIGKDGEIGNDRIMYSYNIYPVLYLNNTLNIVNGDGTKEHPYQIN